MERRKFILGAGAAATGGSALIGSGAFSAMQAERDVTIAVVDDSDALLRLGPCTGENGNEKPNGKYVDDTDGMLSISISEENSPPDGSGVNVQSLTKFYNVFEIENQGNQCICVNIGLAGEVSEVPEISEPVSQGFGFEEGDDAVIFYKGDDESDRIDLENTDPNDGFELCPGESQCIGFNVRAFGFDAGTDIFADLDLRFVAHADADCAVEVPPEPPDAPLEIKEVKFEGRGNGKINPDGPDGLVNPKIWRLTGGGQGDSLESRTLEGFNTAKPIGPEISDRNLNLVAVVFPEQELAVVNKRWNGEIIHQPSTNSGYRSDDMPDLFEGVDIIDKDEFENFLKSDQFPV